VLSARQDDFYGKHMYNNFGDIGTAVRELVDEFQRHDAKGKSMATLEDMQVRDFSLSRICLRGGQGGDMCSCAHAMAKRDLRVLGQSLD